MNNCTTCGYPHLLGFEYGHEQTDEDFITRTIAQVDGMLQGEREDEQARTCHECGGEMCPHGICADNWCGQDEHCHECWRKYQAELDADAEAAWQQNVMGPLLGLPDEQSECAECKAVDAELDEEYDWYWSEHCQEHGCELVSGHCPICAQEDMR